MPRRRTRRAGVFVARRPVAVLLAAVAVAAISVGGARRLTLETDLAAALPEGSPAADGYRAFLDRFAAAERAFVVVRGNEGRELSPDDLAEAAFALAETLAGSPEVSWVRAGIAEADEAFLLRRVAPRLPLLLGADAGAEIARRASPEAAAARASEIRETLAGPAGIALAPLLAADPFGLAADRLREASAGGGLPVDPGTGAFLSEGLDAALVVLRPSRSEVDPEAGEALERALDAAYARTREATGFDLRFDAIGGPLYALHDARAVRVDLVRILGGAAVLVAGMILLAFGGPTIPGIAMLAVALGQLATAGAVGASIGGVTAVGAGFAAILLGLGDDFSVHLGARFREWRVAGSGPGAALARSVSDLGPGVLSSAAATAAAFGVLAFARFPPLRELGFVVAVGVVLLLLATLAVAAPLFLLTDLARRSREEGRSWRGFGRLLERAVAFGASRPRRTIAVALVLLGLAAVTAPAVRLDPDLSRLRPSDRRSAAVERLLAAEFGLGADTATFVISGESVEAALDAADRVAERLRATAAEGLRVTTPSDWIVMGERAARALRSLRREDSAGATARLEAALEAEGLRPAAFAPALDGLRALAAGNAPDPTPLSEWPDWIRDGVHVRADGADVAVHARAPRGLWPDGPPDSLLEEIERAAPGTLAASAPRLGAELRAVALEDVARLGALAIAVVFAIVLLSHRGRLLPTALTLLPVLLGTVWTFGLWGALGLPFDLFSACVIPVMAGIGVDDGLHVLHLARAARSRGLGEAAVAAGRGVVLTNLTTCAGFGALLLSSVPSLRAAGAFVCFGNLACLAAALLVLPAVGTLLESRGQAVSAISRS